MRMTRNIQMPGSALLPPSAEPLPPEGIPPNEGWFVLPPVDPIFTEQTHFEFHGFGMNPMLAEREWVDEDQALWRRFGSGAVVSGAPSPLWRITPSGKALPDAWEGSGCYFLSRRLVEKLEELAPGAIEKVPMRIEDRSGGLVSDDHFVVDVVRRHPAIDWANSAVSYVRFGDSPPVPSPSMTRMMPDLPDDLTVFRDATGRSLVYLRRDVKDQLAKMKPKLRGVHFGGV
jgi:hypothetical protein